MNKRFLIWLPCLCAGALTSAQPSPGTNFETVLRSVPAAELPAVAARLVERAEPRRRAAVATQVVQIALRINPAATVAVVCSVARTEPLSAAESATRAQPRQAPVIARAASSSAPGRAAEIVAGVGALAPEQWRAIALGAASGAPDASNEILKALASLRAELRPYLLAELGQLSGRAPSVASCLDRAERAKARESTGSQRDRHNSRDYAPRPPWHTPPHGEPDPPGGRNYARP